MKEASINKKMIINRIDLIEKHLDRLYELKKLSSREFMLQDNFDIAAWNLRCALESTFNIGGHLVTRRPGVAYESYGDIAIKLGEQGIIPKDFSKNTLLKMGKYRNRLTHFYFEVQPEEMYGIIQNSLGDFEIFLKHIKKLLR